MKRVVILTGDELRHRYFRTKLAGDARFDVVGCVVEGAERSLAARTTANPNAGPTERLHVAGRDQSEQDFFGHLTLTQLGPQDIAVPKGAVNDAAVVDGIKALNPDLLVCYGSSLIKTDLLDIYAGRFLNVHLGLSPYYRGSGTNIWPMINRELHMVGATFMHIDAGIDTGAIIHQIRADVVLGDGPHAIGNRLIRKMTGVYADLIARFDALEPMPQIEAEGVLYRNADWTEDAACRLYDAFGAGLVEDHLTAPGTAPIVENPGLLAS